MTIATRLVDTAWGELLVSDFLYNVWTTYGWPVDEVLAEMVANYQRYGLVDGASIEDGGLL